MLEQEKRLGLGLPMTHVAETNHVRRRRASLAVALGVLSVLLAVGDETRLVGSLAAGLMACALGARVRREAVLDPDESERTRAKGALALGFGGVSLGVLLVSVLSALG